MYVKMPWTCFKFHTEFQSKVSKVPSLFQSDKFPGEVIFVGLINPQDIPIIPPLGEILNRGISVTHFKPANYAEYVYAYVLVFYGPLTLLRSCRARSINLSTLFLGKPLKQFTST